MSNHAAHWDLESDLVFLNHGSFGAAPRCVLEEQARLRAELESSPVRFMYRELEPRLDAARERLGALVGAEPSGLVFVPNATTGVNTALAVLTGQCDSGDGGEGPAETQVGPGDEVLILDPEYNATANAVRFAAARVGASVRVVPVPFPLQDSAEITERVLAAVSKQTRLVVIDHIVSQTGLVLPIEDIIFELRELGIETLVDGAHGPGHLPLSLDDLGAAFYTGNCHKWLCTPKGSAMLHIREDWRARTRPLVISHGANATRKDRSRLHLEFDWPGTFDPTPFLVLPTALDFLEGLFPDGIDELQLRNRELTVEAQGLLCEALGIERPAPTDMLGALASIPLPNYPTARQAPAIQRGPLDLDPLHVWLHDERRIEVPVFPLGDRTILRTSAQAYNEREDYVQLAAALGEWYAG